MSEQKEKSAVGMAIPATEKDNTSKVSITDSEGKIKIVLQFPGEISVVTWMTGHMNDVSTAQCLLLQWTAKSTSV